MYRLSFAKLLNNSSLLFAKSSTCTSCNVQKHNLRLFNNIPQNLLLSNVRTSFRGRYLQGQDTEDAEQDDTFSVLAKSYKEQGRVQALNVFNILGQRDVELFSNDQSLLLLQCCGEAIVDKAPSVRSALCNQVWTKLEECDVSLNLQHYNKYLEICIENKVKLDYLSFISKMKNCDPNEETYHLLLQCACQLGDVTQAIKIIAEMKNKQFSADEKVFNALILGNAINGGLEEAMMVLNTMQSTRIPPSPFSYCYLLRGLAERKNYNEFLKAIEMHPGEINEDEFLKLLRVLGLHGNHVWIDEVLTKTNPDSLTKESLWQLNLLCIHLVHMGKPEAAFYYYKKFALPHVIQEKSEHSVFLFVEMLCSEMPTKKVIELMKDLGDIDYTDTIQRVTEVALRKGFVEAVWDLFAQLPYLRSHYFWPILLKAAVDRRENGIFAVINKMLEFGVKPDMDTFELYIIPNCDSSDPRSLLLRLKHLGFTYKELLTPFLSFLLKEKQLFAAKKLCLISENISVDAERLTSPLCRAWINTKDSSSTVILIKRFCDAKENTDPVGKFLMRLFKACRTPADYNHFLELIKVVQDHNMKISTTNADSIFYYLESLNHRTLTKSVRKAIDSITDDSLNNSYTLIPHPRNMTLNELENHLLELQHKDMETRGVLRKLIQNHCRLGNEARVNELRQQFLDAGYVETAGMKASLFHTYVNKGNDISASNMYNDIKLQHRNFKLDDFKIIDFATLLIQKNKYDAAIKLLAESRAIRGGPEIVRNCWQLLSATHKENHVQNLYKLLIEKGFCVPGNIILGPLVKIHIIQGNLQKAVEVYRECAEKYKCTPLQVELLCAIVEAENEELIHNVINITAKVYGTDAAGVSLISALSQAGLHKSLRKFLLEITINSIEISKLCDRWVQCKDVAALETLANAVSNFPPEKFDETIVYNYLMQMHGVNNDCESAVKFYRQLLDLKINVPPALTQELLRMVHRCNYTVSDDLLKEQVVS